MMRFAEELVAADEVAPGEAKPANDREKQLALHLVDELSGPFDAAKHPDEYRSAVLAAVEDKVEAGQVARDTSQDGETATAPGASAGAQVIDLAELLSRSIQVANKPGPAKTRTGQAEAALPKADRSKSGTKKKRATG
jgi:DNA end-binding protein Ku